MTYQKHIHGRVPLFGKLVTSEITPRIINVIMSHDQGIIDDDQYRESLRDLQKEFSEEDYGRNQRNY